MECSILVFSNHQHKNKRQLNGTAVSECHSSIDDQIVEESFHVDRTYLLLTPTVPYAFRCLCFLPFLLVSAHVISVLHAFLEYKLH